MTKQLAVIFLENPPYLWTTVKNRDDDSKSYVVTSSAGVEKEKYKKTYVHTLMPKNGVELDEQFIWSVFSIYTPYAYIHYGPVKSWKTTHLIDKEVKGAYLCNRKCFNASSGAISLLYWSGKDKNNEYIEFDSEFGKYKVKKAYKGVGNLLPRDNKENAICSIISNGITMDLPRLNSKLIDVDAKGSYISKEHLLISLPLWLVGHDEYSETGGDFRTDVLCKTSDGGTKYQQDIKFLQDCLLYTLCCKQNRVTSDIFYNTCEALLDDEHKTTDIYKLYRELVEATGINGLRNIQKLHKELKADIEKLKYMLSVFQYDVIRPKLLEYELLK